MGDVAIRVNHISKRYQIGEFHEKTLRAQLPAKFHQLFGRHAAKPAATSNTIWALKDLSFELKQGEVLGVIGANGSGKSTLLRILCGVTRPTLGWVGINGRIGSLLGVGTGFNPDLTGRENVYLNGAILGLKRAEITRRFDEIVAFSEVEQFLDTPVKYYSSGMHVRLAFAVAVNLDADILLIDEVLAVGDAAFRQKSMARMAQMVRGEGRTIILVSHDSSSILSLSTKCIYLSHGALITEGDPATVLATYENDSFPKIETEEIKAAAPARGGDGRVRITGLQFLDAHSRQPAASIASGQDLLIEVHYQTQDSTMTLLTNFHLELAVFDVADHFVTTADSRVANGYFHTLPPAGRVYCHLPRLPLMEGTYKIAAYLAIDGTTSDYTPEIATLQVEAADYFQSGNRLLGGRQGVYMDQSWRESPE